MPVLAFVAAKLVAGTTGNKYLCGMLANPQRRLFISQHKAEHHLDAKQQGVEVPYDG